MPLVVKTILVCIHLRPNKIGIVVNGPYSLASSLASRKHYTHSNFQICYAPFSFLLRTVKQNTLSREINRVSLPVKEMQNMWAKQLFPDKSRMPAARLTIPLLQPTSS